VKGYFRWSIVEPYHGKSTAITVGLMTSSSWSADVCRQVPGTCWWSWMEPHSTSCCELCTRLRCQSTARHTWV